MAPTPAFSPTGKAVLTSASQRGGESRRGRVLQCDDVTSCFWLEQASLQNARRRAASHESGPHQVLPVMAHALRMATCPANTSHPSPTVHSPYRWFRTDFLKTPSAREMSYIYIYTEMKSYFVSVITNFINQSYKCDYLFLNQ